MAALIPMIPQALSFIMVDTATHLDGSYAAFGKVTEGMDVVDEIVNTESDAYTNRP